jgi:uncharacterized membrane protein YczE
MLALSRRTRWRIALVRGSLEVTAIAAGWTLGGTAGIGTVASALLIGPAVEAAFWLAERVGIADREPPALEVPPAVLGPAD